MPPPTIFMTTDTVGGVWQYSIDLSSGLARRGLQIILAVCGPPASAAQRQTAEAAGLHLIDTGLPLDWTAHNRADIIDTAQKLAALARDSEADLIHLNSPALAGCGAAFHAPVIAVQHSCVATWWAAVRSGELPPDLAWRAELVSQGLRAADAVVTPTKAFAVVTAETYGLSRLPEVIPNGRSMPAESNARAQEEETAFAFTAGRLWDDGKNVAILDEAADLIELPVLAAGPPKSPQGNEKHFDNLFCLGSITDAEIADILARKPIYVSSAIYEPFGLAVLEAAQAGCPLVVSDIPTFRELWEDAAIFIAPKDASAFAAALAAMAADPHRRAELGQKAKALAAHYSHEAMIERLSAIYTGLPPASAFGQREQVA